MKPETLRRAISEARRFIELAEAVPITSYPAEYQVRSIGYDVMETGKASGAAKRASMDLTRVLADLRQGR
jgi:hypothetical protein